VLRLTLKNYRCFSDQQPAVFEYGRGFTALVGPNNSGKSALLRFIYEYRALWSQLRNGNWIISRANDPTTAQDLGGLRSIVDPEEVICDYTERPVALDAEWQSSSVAPHLKLLSLTTAPKRPNAWKVSALGVPDSAIGFSGPNNLVNEKGEVLLWTPFLEAFEDFDNCLFAPAFRNAINEGAGSLYEFAVGTTTVAQWKQWKTGAMRASKVAIQRITDDIRHVFGFRSLEINTSADDKTFEVVVDGRPFRLNDLGAGLTQFIILFVNVAVRKPALLLIDEPELNLHPSLQVDFLTALASYTSSGSVIFATHSLGLARAVGDRIYTFSPGDKGTVVKPLELTPNYAQFAGEMGFGSYQALGFKTILMVEGPSEIKAVQQFLRLLGHDHDVVILHLGGSSMIVPNRQVELGELLRVTNKVAVLIDSEKPDQHAPLAAERTTFLADCKALGFNAHATERRAFENYLTNNAVQQVKGPKYRALTPYESLKSMSPAWDKNENWRIARVMTKDELLATDVGQFLNEVCTSV
jgi:energy-coupling factor transporter ATP-binding protein EcfA2